MILNAHSDYGIKIYFEFLKGNTNELTEKYLPILRRGNVKFIIMQIGGDFIEQGLDFGDTLIVMKSISFNRQKIFDNFQDFRVITRSEDVDIVMKNEQIGILFSLEGARCIDSDFLILDILHDLGLRSIALTHNKRNQFAEGCLEKSNGGLSNLGENLIHYINKHHMILDLVHLSDRSFWDAIEIIKRPPIISHSNARSLCDHSRNLTNEQIIAIGEKDGVIGLNFYKEFVDKNTDNATLERLINHLELIVELTSIDNAGLGPDFYKYFWPTFQCVQNINDESELPKIVNALLNHGYSDTDINKILLENFLRVIRKNIAK